MGDEDLTWGAFLARAEAAMATIFPASTLHLELGIRVSEDLPARANGRYGKGGDGGILELSPRVRAAVLATLAGRTLEGTAAEQTQVVKSVRRALLSVFHELIHGLGQQDFAEFLRDTREITPLVGGAAWVEAVTELAAFELLDEFLIATGLAAREPRLLGATEPLHSDYAGVAETARVMAEAAASAHGISIADEMRIVVAGGSGISALRAAIRRVAVAGVDIGDAAVLAIMADGEADFVQASEDYAAAPEPRPDPACVIGVLRDNGRLRGESCLRGEVLVP